MDSQDGRSYDITKWTIFCHGCGALTPPYPHEAREKAEEAARAHKAQCGQRISLIGHFNRVTENKEDSNAD